MQDGVFNIERETRSNEDYRRVLRTGSRHQIVLMKLKPGEEIGSEVHGDTDQFIRLEQGTGKAVINGKEYSIRDDWAVDVQAGTRHNIINTSRTEAMKLYTIYSPPHHPPDLVQRDKPAVVLDLHID